MNGSWIQEAVESARSGISIESIERPTEGNRKATAIVVLSKGERVVVQGTADPTALRTETRLASEIAARTTVPVPTVLECGRIDVDDRVNDGRGGAYRVVKAVEGTNLHERFTTLSSGARRRIARRFGRALGQLHEAFAFERFGPVVAAGGGLRADGPSSSSSWDRWFDSYVENAVSALPEPLADLRPPIETATDASSGGDPTPRLFPWDLRPGNTMVDDGEITAFLDWGDPLAATAGLSVAKAEHLLADWYVEDGAPLRAAFRNGYADIRPMPTVTRAERVVAIVDSAVDSTGAVTRPGYPERTGLDAVAFHRRWLPSPP
jgi:hypothetical protein